MENEQTPRDEFAKQVQKKQHRKEKARREQHRSIWFGMGMFGLVGWAVAMPTILFLALGIWIDGQVETQYSWTLMLLVVGVALGCFNAWYWVTKESKRT